jgi:hypothetical protein
VAQWKKSTCTTRQTKYGLGCTFFAMLKLANFAKLYEKFNIAAEGFKKQPRRIQANGIWL